MSHYLIIDGGTTNLRVTLTDLQGRILDGEKRMAGAAQSAEEKSNACLQAAVRESIAALMRRNRLSPGDIDRCLAYGMITSAGGLTEVPHLCAPARLEDFRSNITCRRFEDIAPFPIAFIPGLRNFAGPVTLENLGGMDMMRGEETEALGFYHLVRPHGDCVLMLPGSHNKLIALDKSGAIRGCMTTISGELLAALTHHTVLAEAVDGRFVEMEEYDSEMMLAGARACEAGMGRAAFSTRILSTLGGVSPQKAASFLLGVVLRADLDALNAFEAAQKGAELYIAGKEPLQQALRDLLTAFGRAARPVPAEITGRIGVVGALKIAGCL